MQRSSDKSLGLLCSLSLSSCSETKKVTLFPSSSVAVAAKTKDPAPYFQLHVSHWQSSHQRDLSPMVQERSTQQQFRAVDLEERSHEE